MPGFATRLPTGFHLPFCHEAEKKLCSFFKLIWEVLEMLNIVPPVCSTFTRTNLKLRMTSRWPLDIGAIALTINDFGLASSSM